MNLIQTEVSHDAGLSAAAVARDRAAAALFSLQNDDGHWRAELEGDSCLLSEFILLKWIVGEEDDPRLVRVAESLRRAQTADGGWPLHPGGAADVSLTVKGCVALRLMGDGPDERHMVAARRAVLEGGGAERCNSFTNFYLACLGLVDWNAVPAIPPELLYLPRWCPFHLDHMSAWTRTMVIPLAICTATRPVRRVEHVRSVRDLFRDSAYEHRLHRRFNVWPFTWNNFFLLADGVLKAAQQADAIPTRERALRDAAAWVTQRSDPRRTEGLGAIFPAMVYTAVAFKALGHGRGHAVYDDAMANLDALVIDEPGNLRIQPCLSPVWDTGIALYALAEAGADPREERIRRACAWLRARQVDFRGDWSRAVDVEPGGWAFEYRNDFYPDVDDTAMVAMALRRLGGPADHAAGRRGIDWLLAFQNDDGGWAAFDRTRDRPLLEAVPFADHNAIQDPSCPDITGRVLESLGHYGIGPDHEAVRRAVAYLRRTQEPEGGWFGRWGVNYIYGTYQVLVGLDSVGWPMDEGWTRRAAAWLKSVQKSDGSFGETPDSYADRSLMGRGPSTASQTAWGAMGLLAVASPDDPHVRRAIDWLVQTQLVDSDGENPAGSWSEPWFTGTGFPRVFYLRYHLYRLYFPLMALGRFVNRSRQ